MQIMRTEYITYPPDHMYRVYYGRHEVIWPSGWDHQHDFDMRKAIFRSMRKLLRITAKKVGIALLKATGDMRRAIPEHKEMITYSDIRIGSLEELVDEAHALRKMSISPVMILVPHRMHGELDRHAGATFAIKKTHREVWRAGGSEIYILYDVPVVVSSYYDGDPIVLPDLTGKAEWRALVRQETAKQIAMEMQHNGFSAIDNSLDQILPRWRSIR